MHKSDKRRKPAIDRFMDRVQPEPNSGCWLWTGAAANTGYGTFSPSQKRDEKVLAHRWSYQHFIGEIADAMVIDHLCRVRCCVNPEHMEVVTRGENVRRGDAPAHIARRNRACERGHALTPENTIGRAKARCWTCHHEWKEQREVAELLQRMVDRTRATAALHQPNQ